MTEKELKTCPECEGSGWERFDYSEDKKSWSEVPCEVCGGRRGLTGEIYAIYARAYFEASGECLEGEEE